MRIDDKNLSNIDASQVGRTKAAEAQEQARQREQTRARGAGEGDEVQLSSLAESVQSLDPNSPASQARLERLSALVASGRYEPDAEKLSERIIDDALKSEGPAPPAGGEDS